MQNGTRDECVAVSLLADAVAKAVLYVVTQPIEVNIDDIVVRPPMSIANLS